MTILMEDGRPSCLAVLRTENCATWEVEKLSLPLLGKKEAWVQQEGCAALNFSPPILSAILFSIPSARMKSRFQRNWISGSVETISWGAAMATREALKTIQAVLDLQLFVLVTIQTYDSIEKSDLQLFLRLWQPTPHPHGHMIKIPALGNQHLFTLRQLPHPRVASHLRFFAANFPQAGSTGEVGFV